MIHVARMNKFSTHISASCHESLLASYICIREKICSVCEEHMFTIQNTLSESHLNESCRTYESVFAKTLAWEHLSCVSRTHVWNIEDSVWVTHTPIILHVWISFFQTHKRERICSLCEEHMLAIQKIVSESHVHESYCTYEWVVQHT